MTIEQAAPLTISQEVPAKDDPHVLRLARRSNRCTVLGPGTRAVLWVQGCPFRCQGCVAPETLSFAGGTSHEVAALADDLIALPEDIGGLTFSGGEPMSQASALSRLIDFIGQKRDFSYVSYTGFTLEWIETSGTPAQKSLLRQLDMLIDGPYVNTQHSDLIWRGSENQRVHLLTSRYKHLSSTLEKRGRWIEVEFSGSGGLHWMGIPPRGFRDSFEAALANKGIDLEQ